MNDDVGCELAVGIAPVEVVVIDESAIEHNAPVRLKSRGQQVGGVGGRAAIAGGAGLAFTVGLDGEAREVRNECVDFVDLGRPPGFDRRVGRVVGRKAADLLRAGESHAHRHADTPGRHRIRDARDLLEVV